MIGIHVKGSGCGLSLMHYPEFVWCVWGKSWTSSVKGLDKHPGPPEHEVELQTAWSWR